MEWNAKSTTWGRYKAWLRALAVLAALVPLVGIGIARNERNMLLGLAGAAAMAFCIFIGQRVEDRRRRKREARDHVAALARW